MYRDEWRTVDRNIYTVYRGGIGLGCTGISMVARVVTRNYLLKAFWAVVIYARANVSRSLLREKLDWQELAH